MIDWFVKAGYWTMKLLGYAFRIALSALIGVFIYIAFGQIIGESNMYEILIGISIAFSTVAVLMIFVTFLAWAYATLEERYREIKRRK